MNRNGCMPSLIQSRPTGTPPVHSVAYLISCYPKLSGAFVLREVMALRALGISIQTASINPPDRPAEQMTGHEQTERLRT